VGWYSQILICQVLLVGIHMSKNLLSWYEPYFFVARLRTGRDWLWRLVWFAGISAIMFGILRAFQGAMPWGLALETSLLVGLSLALLPDLFFLQRDVTITTDSIDWEALRIAGSFPHAGTSHVELLRPDEWKFKFGGMRITSNTGQWFLFAIPKGKRLETVAAVLTRLSIPVHLSGWEPTTADTRTRVEEELTFDHLSSTRDAVFTPLSPEEPKLVSTVGKVLAAAVGGGPVLIALPVMVGTWIYLAIYWGKLANSERWMIGLGGVGGFVLCFVFMFYIGQFIEKAMLVSMGQKGLRTRINPLVHAEDDDVYPVSIYPRESWTKVISMSADFGFLQVNRRQAAIVFEGEKERWMIPLTALTAVRVEEAEVGKEGSENPEIRFFVVIGTHRDGASWEVGLIRTRTNWGYDGPTARRDRMGALFDELRAAITYA